jgi:hypothetical protein
VFIYAASEKSAVLSPTNKIIADHGFCGGYTTFSTFAFENMSLLRSGDILYFSLYTVGSVASGHRRRFCGHCNDETFINGTPGQSKLLRVFVGEIDKVGHQLLYEAILLAARRKAWRVQPF